MPLLWGEILVPESDGEVTFRVIRISVGKKTRKISWLLILRAGSICQGCRKHDRRSHVLEKWWQIWYVSLQVYYCNWTLAWYNVQGGLLWYAFPNEKVFEKRLDKLLAGFEITDDQQSGICGGNIWLWLSKKPSIQQQKNMTKSVRHICLQSMRIGVHCCISSSSKWWPGQRKCYRIIKIYRNVPDRKHCRIYWWKHTDPALSGRRRVRKNGKQRGGCCDE